MCELLVIKDLLLKIIWTSTNRCNEWKYTRKSSITLRRKNLGMLQIGEMCFSNKKRLQLDMTFFIHVDQIQSSEENVLGKIISNY